MVGVLDAALGNAQIWKADFVEDHRLRFREFREERKIKKKNSMINNSVGFPSNSNVDKVIAFDWARRRILRSHPPTANVKSFELSAMGNAHCICHLVNSKVSLASCMCDRSRVAQQPEHINRQKRTRRNNYLVTY